MKQVIKKAPIMVIRSEFRPGSYYIRRLFSYYYVKTSVMRLEFPFCLKKLALTEKSKT